MHRHAIINQKGGVAKTTTAVNLAGALAELGKRVLLADLDPQSQSTLHCDIAPPGPDEDSAMYRVLVRQKPIAQCAVRTDFGFDILAAGEDLAAAEQMLGTQGGRLVYSLREGLAALPIDAYDVVLFDCPPALGYLSRAALVASTGFLVPITMQQAPLEGFAQLLKTIEIVRANDNPTLGMIGVLGCNTPRGSSLATEVRADLVLACGADAMFKKEVRYSEYIARAFKKKKPVTHWASGSIGAEDYRAVASEFVERGGV